MFEAKTQKISECVYTVIRAIPVVKVTGSCNKLVFDEICSQFVFFLNFFRPRSPLTLVRCLNELQNHDDRGGRIFCSCTKQSPPAESEFVTKRGYFYSLFMAAALLVSSDAH